MAVEGQLQIRSYEAQDGSRRKVAEVVADRIQFLDQRNGNSAKAQGLFAVDDETVAEPAAGAPA